MTWLAVYAFIKYWLPMTTAAGLLFKLYFIIRNAVRRTMDDIGIWANTLLDNHLTHIQASAEQASASLKELSETNREVASSMKSMREDFQETQVENLRVQSNILTGIEVLRDRG